MNFQRQLNPYIGESWTLFILACLIILTSGLWQSAGAKTEWKTITRDDFTVKMPAPVEEVSASERGFTVHLYRSADESGAAYSVQYGSEVSSKSEFEELHKGVLDGLQQNTGPATEKKSTEASGAGWTGKKVVMTYSNGNKINLLSALANTNRVYNLMMLNGSEVAVKNFFDSFKVHPKATAQASTAEEGSGIRSKAFEEGRQLGKFIGYGIGIIIFIIVFIVFPLSIIRLLIKKSKDDSSKN